MDTQQIPDADKGEALALAESIISTVREPLLVLDENLRVVKANRSFYQNFHVTEEETLHRFVYDLGNGQWDIPRLRTLLEEILPQSQSFQDFEVEHDFPEIGRKVMFLNARRLHADGEKILLAIEDVTERKALEKALRDRSDQLAEADRRKDEFLAMLAHELRNPLAPLRNAVEIIRHDPAENPHHQQANSIIERQVRLMARLVDDLLEVSRISTGKVRLHKERVDLRQVVNDAVESARPLLDARRHTLATSLPDTPIWVEADPMRLQQVMANLLNNAAKYTEVGGRVWLTVKQQGQIGTVAVKDTGIGIEPDMLPRIFDLFAQASRTEARSQDGLGIGLALVRSLLELHGGSVEARSEGLGKGCEFVVRLPVSAPPEGRAEGDEPAKPPVPRLRLLVVDDNVDAAESLAMLLRLSGHQVQTAYVGSTALEGAQQFRPHAMLLDIGLPVMSGYEVARRLRKLPDMAKVVLIATTGYGSETDQRRATEAGCNFHMVKPVDPQKLQELLTGLTPSE